MSVDLLKLLKDAVLPSLTDKLPQVLGESPEAVTKGLGLALPAVLGAVVAKGSDNHSGAESILSLLNSPAVSQIAAPHALDANALTSLQNNSGSILSALFPTGEKTNSLISQLASNSGLSLGGGSKLMSIAAPLVLSFLGKHVAQGGLNASGLMGLLSSQKSLLSSVLPSWLSGSLGSLGLGSLIGGAANVAGNVVGGAANVAGNVVGGAANVAGNVVGGTARVAGDVAEAGGGLLRKLLPLLGLLLAGLLAFSLLRGCHKAEAPVVEAPVVEAPVVEAPAVVAPAVDAAADAVKSAATDVAAVVSSSLSAASDALKALVPGKSTAEDLTKALNLAVINFASGSSAIPEENKAELNESAAAIKLFPEVKLQVGGHTDSQGSAASNLKLSDRRAAAVKAYLVAQGVSAAQLSAKGFGAANPVADNGTEDGRFKNRRIEFTVAK